MSNQETAPKVVHWWQRKKIIIAFVILGTLVLIALLIFAAHTYHWDLTTATTTEVTQLPQKKVTITETDKTFLDWLQLIGVLAIPIVVGFGTAFFTRQQAKTSEANAENQQQEELLRTYIDKISDLLLDKELSTKELSTNLNIQSIVRARTLAALHILNTERKTIVLRFLHDSGFLQHVKSFFYLLDLSHTDLNRINLSSANLSSANLSNTDLFEANLTGTNLSNINLSGANLSGAILYGAHLTGAHLSNANLSGANLFGASSRAAGVGINLSGAILSGINLSGVKLYGANLSNADLSGANLSEALLSGANLWGTNLNGANLSGADLSNANTGLYLPFAYLSNTNLNTADLRVVHLSNANLSGANLSGADLSGAKLYGANLNRAKLSLTSFTPIQLEEAKNITPRQRAQIKLSRPAAAQEATMAQPFITLSPSEVKPDQTSQEEAEQQQQQQPKQDTDETH